SGRVAQPGGAVPDDQHRLVAQVLELAQLREHDGVPEMDVGSGWIHAELHPQRDAARQPCLQVLLGVHPHGIAREPRELLRGRHAATRSRPLRMAVARPVVSSTSITAPCTSTGPDATSNRTGIWLRNRAI